jgi:nucleotide-binding universal stress UspA family protein
MGTTTILLAADGSRSAADATHDAIGLADALDAKLVVVAVDHPISPGNGFYGSSELLAQRRAAEHARTAAALAQVSAAAREVGVECEPVQIGPGGRVAEEICRTAETREARLIVIGTHGWGRARRIANGSISTAVVHAARRPVLVVPAR